MFGNKNKSKKSTQPVRHRYRVICTSAKRKFAGKGHREPEFITSANNINQAGKETYMNPSQCPYWAAVKDVTPHQHLLQEWSEKRGWKTIKTRTE